VLCGCNLLFVVTWRRAGGGAAPGAAERSTGGQRRLGAPRWGIWWVGPGVGWPPGRCFLCRILRWTGSAEIACAEI